MLLALCFISSCLLICDGFSASLSSSLRVSTSARRGDASMMFNFFSSGSSSSSIPKNKNLVVITGTSSGLGKETTRALLANGNYYVICAVRDVEKMKKIADEEGFDKSKYTILELDLASFKSTRNFVTKLSQFKKGRPLDTLVCNAAVYQPALSVASSNKNILIAA